MTLRFQRLIIIIISISLLFSALLLILFNSKQNIIFFYTPSEIINKNINQNKKIRIGGFVEKNSLKKNSELYYEFNITDNKNSIKVFYNGILPDLFREEQGAVIEGIVKDKNTIIGNTVYAKHDENYMPSSIKDQLEENKYWKKDYK